MGNSALQSNPPNAAFHITTHTSDWLWAVFALMTLSNLIMIGWTHNRIRGQRAFHYLSIAILSIAMVAYYAMASDLGSIPIETELRARATRQIWYTRYIYWVLTMPLLVLTLLLGTGLALSDIFISLFMIIFFFINYLFGATTISSYKWGFYVFGTAALVYVLYHIVFSARRSVGFLGAPATTSHNRSSLLLAFLFLLYPIAWALSEGGNVISPTGEMVFYGILDLLIQPVWLFAYVWQLSAIDYATWGFTSGRLTENSAALGTHRAGAGVMPQKEMLGRPSESTAVGTV